MNQQPTSIVYQEDCMAVMRSFPDKYFDLAICDVPYGINVGQMAYLRHGKTSVKQKSGLRTNFKRIVREKEDWDSEPPTQDYFDELIRVSKGQIIFGVEYVDWQGLGQGRIKWNKGVPKGMSFKSYEMAYCSLIDYTMEIDLLWSGMMQASSLNHPMTQQGNKKLNEKRLHPCHKPRLLYKKLLQEFAAEGMKIIDTHVGAGSIRIECDLAKCHFIGAEISPKHWQTQEKRFRQHKSVLTLF